MKKQKLPRTLLRVTCAALLTVGALQSARADYESDILSQGPVGSPRKRSAESFENSLW